jgi:hypothetical protein
MASQVVSRLDYIFILDKFNCKDENELQINISKVDKLAKNFFNEVQLTDRFLPGFHFSLDALLTRIIFSNFSKTNYLRKIINVKKRITPKRNLKIEKINKEHSSINKNLKILFGLEVVKPAWAIRAYRVLKYVKNDSELRGLVEGVENAHEIESCAKIVLENIDLKIPKNRIPAYLDTVVSAYLILKEVGHDMSDYHLPFDIDGYETKSSKERRAICEQLSKVKDSEPQLESGIQPKKPKRPRRRRRKPRKKFEIQSQSVQLDPSVQNHRDQQKFSVCNKISNLIFAFFKY